MIMINLNLIGLLYSSIVTKNELDSNSIIISLICGKEVANIVNFKRELLMS